MNHDNLAYANIHRFGDNIAIWLDTEDNRPTCYLSEREARDLSKQLLKYAQDVKNRKFTNSQLGTFTIKK